MNKKEKEAKIKALLVEYDLWKHKSFVSIAENRADIEFKNGVLPHLGILLKMGEILGYKPEETTVSSYHLSGGCDTCDYGSETEYTITFTKG